MSVTVALYGPGDDVVELTPSNWDKRVMQDDGLWIIEFYAPWYVMNLKRLCTCILKYSS